MQILLLDDEMPTNGIEPLFDNEPYGILVTNNPNDAREALGKENIKVIVEITHNNFTTTILIHISCFNC